ncbi:Hypothetical protein A7982_08344 [Minicystis rosea]|nr:Hypothetical protein A7982_08344 [Minicystis rosea]
MLHAGTAISSHAGHGRRPSGRHARNPSSMAEADTRSANSHSPWRARDGLRGPPRIARRQGPPSEGAAKIDVTAAHPLISALLPRSPFREIHEDFSVRRVRALATKSTGC